MAKGNRAYRRVSKRKTNVNVVNKERLKLERKTQEEINKVNKRLQSLQRGGYAGSWSSKKLMNRLGTKRVGTLDVTRRGGAVTGVKLRKGLTNTQLIAVQKASRQFLESQTSTVKGIKEVREKTIASLQVSLSDMDKGLSNEDVEFLYDMLEIQEMQDLTEQFGASRIWDISQDSIEANESRESFLKRFEREIATLNDKDMLDKANRIYDYISKKNK